MAKWQIVRFFVKLRRFGRKLRLVKSLPGVVTCPHCHGKAFVTTQASRKRAMANKDGSHERQYRTLQLDCFLCRGAGKVEQELYDWYMVRSRKPEVLNHSEET